MRAAIALLALLAIGAAKPDWTLAVRAQPNGAFMMGNPQAKVKFIEYISYTCGHCAHFVASAAGPLKRDYVARGTVSVEFRNAVRDQFDMTAALLARCGGPRRFFGNSEAILAMQGEWLGRAQAFVEAEGARLKSLPPNEGLKLVARGVGLDRIMIARGFTPAQIAQCLASKADQAAIAAMTNEAWNVRKIGGTPAFLIDGQQVKTGSDWVLVEPYLKSALAEK